MQSLKFNTFILPFNINKLQNLKRFSYLANIFIDYENKEEKLRDEILKVKTHLPENPLETLEIYPITFGVKKHHGEVNMISLINTFFD